MNRVILAVPLILFALLGVRECLQGAMPDLFIYRAGAVLGLRHLSPYSDGIRQMVAAQWPEDQRLIDNCGFFLPPQAVPVFAPFAILPWPAAKILYTLLTLIAIVVCWYGVTQTFGLKHSNVPWPLAWFVTLHLITVMTYMAGQTTILAAACIVLGQWLCERNRSLVGMLFWSLAFVKPHVALPLLPLAFILGGWKRGMFLLLWLAVLNGLGCLLAGVSPFEYLDYLSAAHKGVLFNQVAANVQITSWNRVWYSLTDQAIDLSTTQTLIGYALFFAVAALRFRNPTPAEAVAIAAVGAVFCCQVLAYESFLLVLTLPWILQRWPGFPAIAVAVLLALGMNPVEPVYDFAQTLPPRLGAVLVSYRSWLVAFIAIVILASPRRVD